VTGRTELEPLTFAVTAKYRPTSTERQISTDAIKAPRNIDLQKENLGTEVPRRDEAL
jgi:hypothetical protein